MDIPVNLDGFANQRITLQPRGVFQLRVNLLLDGQPVAARWLRPRRYGYLISDDHGKQIEVRVCPRFWDPVPDLEVEGKRVELLAPFKTYEHLWICIPIAIVTFGGFLGGACGAIAVGINYGMFRRIRHTILKYVTTGCVSICALLLYFGMYLLLLHGFGIGGRWSSVAIGNLKNRLLLGPLIALGSIVAVGAVPLLWSLERLQSRIQQKWKKGHFSWKQQLLFVFLGLLGFILVALVIAIAFLHFL